MKKKEQVALLTQYDQCKEACGDLLERARHKKPMPSGEPHHTHNCIYCLLNVLFDDEFSDHFAKIGKFIKVKDFLKCRTHSLIIVVTR